MWDKEEDDEHERQYIKFLGFFLALSPFLESSYMVSYQG